MNRFTTQDEDDRYYTASRSPRYKQGLCMATINVGDDDTEDVEITYEAEEVEIGSYEVSVSRPFTLRKPTDLHADVVEALLSDGIENVANLNWL
jgi:hypothetical protein